MTGARGRKMRGSSAVAILLVGFVSACAAELRGQTLTEARAGFQTKIIRNLRDTETPDLPPAGKYKLILFPSAVGQLAAYLSGDPADGHKHPAVIWSHGGLGGISSYFFGELPVDNEQSPKAFDEAGMVVMIPSWRGTANNPGRQEFFYGEVDDLLAAVKYVKTLPYVDPERVYIVGHSTGATLALLAAEAPAPVRAVFAFGAVGDVSGYLDGNGDPQAPFDASNADEIRLRSPVNFVAAVQSPTFCIEGSRSANARSLPLFQASADARNAPLHTFVVPHATHFNILHPITRVIAAKIAADTAPTCNIQITSDELAKAFNTFLDEQARNRTSPLVTVTDAMSAHVAQLAQARGIDPSKIYLRVDLTEDDRILVRLTTAIQPGDLTSQTGSVNLALTPEANRAMNPIQLDYDNSSRKMVISHIKSP